VLRLAPHGGLSFRDRRQRVIEAGDGLEDPAAGQGDLHHQRQGGGAEDAGGGGFADGQVGERSSARARVVDLLDRAA
jgi:hypothetical protein